MERIKPSPCAPICAAICSSSARKTAIRANAATRAAAFPKADANAHGYGLRSVCDCVHHLGGEMTLSDENRLFVVNVLLPAAGG
ncbi:MAG: GHKL domain-containing protein [Christensenellales bacterium]